MHSKSESVASAAFQGSPTCRLVLFAFFIDDYGTTAVGEYEKKRNKKKQAVVLFLETKKRKSKKQVLGRRNANFRP